MAEPQRMYDWEEAAKLVGVAVRTLNTWVKQGRFPQPHKSGATVRWFDYEITEWQIKFKLGLIPPAPKKKGSKTGRAE